MTLLTLWQTLVVSQLLSHLAEWSNISQDYYHFAAKFLQFQAHCKYLQ